MIKRGACEKGGRVWHDAKQGEGEKLLRGEIDFSIRVGAAGAQWKLTLSAGDGVSGA